MINKKQIPNILTVSRVIFIPLLMLTYLSDSWIGYFLSAVIFGIAGITDWLDGYLARRYDVQSSFGAFLDPVADKLIVTVALVLLVSNRELHSMLWSPIVFILMCSIIICREVLVSALREFMAERGNRDAVKVSQLGKWKTTFQITAIIILLLHWKPLMLIGEFSLFIAMVLTIWSMIDYSRSAARSL